MFKENFFWLKGSNVWIILIIDKNGFFNSEYLTSQLIKYDNWDYHYFIPSIETLDKNNMLLFNFFDNSIFDKKKHNLIDLDKLNITFSNSIFYQDLDTILHILTNNIIWNKTNFNNHSLIWCLKTQQLVSNYLDLILYSDYNNGLDHWGFSKLELKKNKLLKNLDYKNYFHLYNEFLKINKNLNKSDQDLK